MSASEQEVQSQVAGMREALRSAAASRRIAKIVGILAVIVGLCMVAFFVLQILNMGRSIIENPEELEREATKQIELLDLDKKVTEIAEKALPAYAKEVETLFLEDKELQSAASAELSALLKDLEPVITEELARMRPRLEEMLEKQADRTLQAIEATLEQSLSQRLALIMEDNSGQLAGQAQLTPERLAEVADQLQSGLQGAVQIVWQRRAGNLEAEMNAINELVAQIPDRDPQLTPEETYKDIMLVLVALMREELPPYDTSGLNFPATRGVGRRRGPGAAVAVPEEAREAAAAGDAEAAEAMEKAQEVARETQRKAIEAQRAREAAERAEGGQR
jgi:hypothetical protein